MTETRSYYGRPVLKEPVWTWEIPVYFFTGGLAGASSVLSLVAKLRGNLKLGAAALYIGAAADAVSPLLLISDLGRPERFHHMLRVFKPTSPMNVGAWILLASGGASNTAALLELTGRLRPVKLAAEVVAALSGPPLATYTGVLVADTAVPVWHEGRHELLLRVEQVAELVDEDVVERLELHAGPLSVDCGRTVAIRRCDSQTRRHSHARAAA